MRDKIDVLAVAAGAICEWRGVVSIDGLPEFRTTHTFDSADAAYLAAQKLLPQAHALVAENTAALAAEIQAISDEMGVDKDIQGRSWGWRLACEHYSELLQAALSRVGVP